MFRVIFLMVIFVVQVWCSLTSVKAVIKPHSYNKSIAQLYAQVGGSKVAVVMNEFDLFFMLLYVSVLSLNASLINNHYVAVAFLILAAAEIIVFFIRLSRTKEIYSGTVEEMTEKWKQAQRSWQFLIGLLFNIVETVFIGWGLYLILTAGHIFGR